MSVFASQKPHILNSAAVSVHIQGVPVKSSHEHGSATLGVTVAPTGVSNCNEPMKDDEDDNDDDDDDDVKLQSSGIDPDRLKAFNVSASILKIITCLVTAVS